MANAFKVIRRIELIKGGYTIKQGEVFTLGFQLYDSDGTIIIPTVNQTIGVKIANPTGVIYETNASIVDDHIEFTVDENIGFGQMDVELKVTEGTTLIQKYPADDFIKLKITKSLDDVNVGNIYAVTAEQMFTLIADTQSQFDAVVNRETDTDAMSRQAAFNTDGVDKGNLKVRLDEDYNKTTSQLAETSKQTESFIGSSGFANIQTAINEAITKKKKLKIPSGTYLFTSGLVIDGDLQIEGTVKATTFDFTAMASGVAITVGNLNTINGLIMSGLKIKGTPNLTGLKLNGTSNIAKPVTDSAFRDLRIENFGIGLLGGYSWCNLFENVRFQGCVKPLELTSQFNNTEFTRVSLAGGTTPSTFTNCEGINFTSPNIANITGDAMTLYQTNVSILNPYYEYISGYVAKVGGSTETIASTFTSIGGKSTDAEVKVGVTGNRCTLLLKNLSPFSKFVVDDGNESVTPYKHSNRIEMDSNEMYENDFLVKWDGTTPVPFASSYGGVILTKAIHPEKYTKVTTDAGVTSGFQIATLTVGERYVFVYSLRKQAGSAVSVKLGALASSVLSVKDQTEEFEIRYLPFTAKDTLFRLMWSANTTLDISFLGIVKGSKFPQIPKNKGTMSATGIPTSETWKVGDRVLNSSPVAGGYEGWTCTVAGTPGTWKGYGLIQV